MSITTNWAITQLDSDKELNAVFNVHISLTASNGINTAEKKFVVGFQHQDGDTFIPYDQLTEEIVLGWVKAKLDTDVERFEDEVSAMFIQTSPVESGLPW